MTRTIALIGSGEFEPWSEEVDRRLLERSSGDGSVLIVPTASAREGETFNVWAAKGIRHYERMGVPARVASLRDRNHAFRGEFCGYLETVSLVYFSGGNPSFLARTLAGTRFWSATLDALDRGASYAGCSAGACVSGEFAPETVSEPVEEDRWIQGLRLLPNVWVMPHWDAIRAEVRDHFLSTIPDDGLLLAIDEETAVLGDGATFEVYGKGTAMVRRDGASSVFQAGGSFELRTAATDRGQLDAGVVHVVDRIPEGCGAIGLLSSDEFTPDVEEFGRRLLEATGPRVGVLLCADPATANQQAAAAREHFGSLGAEPIVLDVLERGDARPEALPDCDILFLGGGSPSTLLECLRGTPLWEDVLRRWAGGLAIAGSSAGAMALCASCLEPSPGADVPTNWSKGLGPLSGCALGVHAASRPPEWLQQVVTTAPVPVVAIDDATGLILRPGIAPRVVGAGRAWVVDPSSG
ncbi:MAG: Type 1 glutamine amidotransferase-like domain-containing protein [Actinomycetota bacterium]